MRRYFINIDFVWSLLHQPSETDFLLVVQNRFVVQNRVVKPRIYNFQIAYVTASSEPRNPRPHFNRPLIVQLSWIVFYECNVMRAVIKMKLRECFLGRILQGLFQYKYT